MNPFEQALLEQHKRNTDLIQKTVLLAAQTGCGMVVRRNKDGTVSAWLDAFAKPYQMNVIDEE